jgi:hypothetical protein
MQERVLRSTLKTKNCIDDGSAIVEVDCMVSGV